MSSTNESEHSTSVETEAPSAIINIRHIRIAYSTADDLTRKVANFRSDVSIPAHNELRYAGFHLLKSLDDNGCISNHDEAVKARNHCQRAMYEAADAGILSALDMIAIFRNDYKNIVIADVVPDIVNIYGRARNAQKLIETGRKHSHQEAIVPDEFISCFLGLTKDCETLEDSREELNKIIRTDRIAGKRWLIGICVGIFAILISVAIAL